MCTSADTKPPRHSGSILPFSAAQVWLCVSARTTTLPLFLVSVVGCQDAPAYVTWPRMGTQIVAESKGGMVTAKPGRRTLRMKMEAIPASP